MSRAARAAYEARQGVQTDQTFRLLLARRRERRTAATHLRRRLRDQKTLDAYLQQQAEAEKRDHRRIGKQLDFFHLQEEAPGMVFWHAKGWVIYREIENYMRGKLRKYGYEEVQGPQILDRSLWEKSGHWDKFGGNMFTCCIDEHDYAIKPMNCPGHIQIFNQGLRSYRELPVRYAEFGICHRNEPSGTLHGLMRVRRFVQDDGHIFCTRSQIREEIERVCQMVYEVYHDFGFDEVELALSTRPEKRVGSDEIWDEAEADLQAALEAQGKPFRLTTGRRRVLRAENRIYPERQPRPPLAMRYGTARFLHAGTPRRALHRRKRHAANAGDDSPRHPRLAGALYRHPD